MIRLPVSAVSACLDRDLGLTGAAGWLSLAEVEVERDRSLAAGYALRAIQPLRHRLRQPALVCMSGPTGAHIHRFDTAWKAADGGSLTGPGFRRRARKIHPFTLLLSLQNQVASILSMEYNLRGPCLNSISSGAVVGEVLCQVSDYLEEEGQVLLVFASAAGRAEEDTLSASIRLGRSVVQGSVCVLLESRGVLGYMCEASGSAKAPIDHWHARKPYDPVLAPGLGLIDALSRGRSARICVRDWGGVQGSFDWEAT